MEISQNTVAGSNATFSPRASIPAGSERPMERRSSAGSGPMDQTVESSRFTMTTVSSFNNTHESMPDMLDARPGAPPTEGMSRGKTEMLSGPLSPSPQDQFMVRVPPGLRPGQLIQATAPDGQVVTAAIPPDVKPGQLIAVPCRPMTSVGKGANERAPLVKKGKTGFFTSKAIGQAYFGTWICTNLICWMLYFWVIHFNIGNTPWALWVLVFSSLPWLLVFPKWMAAWLGLNVIAWFLWWSVAQVGIIYIPWPAIITVLTSICMIFVLRELLQKELEVTVPAAP